MAFTNSRQDLTADTVSTLDLTADVGHITDLHAEQLSLGADSTTINKMLFGTTLVSFVIADNALSPVITHNFGYAPVALLTVAGSSVYFPYVWTNGPNTIQFGIRQFERVSDTVDMLLYYLLLGATP